MKKLSFYKFIIFITISFTSVYCIAENTAAEKKPVPDVIISTTFGKIWLRLLPDIAPGHVENFIKLAESGFYDGTQFHRIIPGFMIQGGDPNTRGDDKSKYGQGGPGYTIDQEFNDMPHRRGMLSMARAQDPNSAGSQFFIVVQDSFFLDRQYTVFGEVISGMGVADLIVNQERDRNDAPLERIDMTVKLLYKKTNADKKE